MPVIAASRAGWPPVISRRTRSPTARTWSPGPPGSRPTAAGPARSAGAVRSAGAARPAGAARSAGAARPVRSAGPAGPQCSTTAPSSDRLPSTLDPPSRIVPASPAPAAVNGRPGAAAAASIRSPCTVRPSATSAGPVPLASRAPVISRSPPISARASRTAPSGRSPCARKPRSSSALPPTRTRSAASAGPMLLTSAVSRSTRSRRIVLPDRHSAPGLATGVLPGVAPTWRGCPGPALATLLTRAPSSTSSPASAAPRSSTVPVAAAPVAWNSVPDAGLRASLVSPLTRIPSASRAGPVALVSQAPRSSRWPPILAPVSRTAPDRPARPAARSPSSKTPVHAPSPTFSAAPVRAAPELLAMLVPRILSSFRICAPSS